jgi:protein-S-isoprenylcysteine O-methyltransferase Ste14
MKRRLKINSFITCFAVILLVIFPKFFLRNEGVLRSDKTREIFGVAFILLGQILRVSARGFKSEHSRRGSALIQEGPYNLVRNPMYLGILLIGLGFVMALFKWWAFCIFSLFFIARYLLLIFKEEKYLVRLFPDTYPDYCKRVPRILPSPKKLFTQDMSAYLPLKLAWIKKEIVSIFIVLFLVFFIESLEEIFSRSGAIYMIEIITILLVVALFIYVLYYLSRKTGDYRKDVSIQGQTPL